MRRGWLSGSPTLSVGCVLILVAPLLGAIARTRHAPSFAELTRHSGKVHRVRQERGLRGGVRIGLETPGGVKTFWAGFCSAFADSLRAGDVVEVWAFMERGLVWGETWRAWQIQRADATVCVFEQARAKVESVRRNVGLMAVGSLAAGAALCAGALAARARSRRPGDPGSARERAGRGGRLDGLG